MDGSKTEREVKKVINKLKPYLNRDGGDIDFVKMDDDGVVYVNMLGACAGCYFVMYDLKEGIETILMEEVPGVTEVRVI